MLPFILAGLALAGLAALLRERKPKTVFISYDYDHDRRYKNMLVAWAKNEKFPIRFDDRSADVAIDSTDEAVQRRAISAKIHRSDMLVLLVGREAHKSRWIRWETAKAVHLGKPIVAVKLKKKYRAPAGLRGRGVVWATSFKVAQVKAALERSSG